MPLSSLSSVLTGLVVRIQESGVPDPGVPGGPGGPGEDIGWRTWPFGPGYAEGFLPLLAKIAFITVIFLGIIWFLRFLYGPKGKFRDHEVDAEYEAQRAQQLAELDRRLAAGEITKERYEWLKDRI